MTIFIDSANLDEIKSAFELGVVKGVTTNQSIFLKSGYKYSPENYMLLIKQIAEEANGFPVSIELTNVHGDLYPIIEDAIAITKIADNINIKVPMLQNGNGLRLIKRLSELDIKVNATCLMTPAQAILASEAGAYYVSLFYRRMLDNYGECVEMVGDDFHTTKAYLEFHSLGTKLIAGSIRKPGDVTQCFKYGADIVTVPYPLLLGMIPHPKTQEVIEEFDKSWKQFVSNK